MGAHMPVVQMCDSIVPVSMRRRSICPSQTGSVTTRSARSISLLELCDTALMSLYAMRFASRVA